MENSEKIKKAYEAFAKARKEKKDAAPGAERNVEYSTSDGTVIEKA